MHVTQQNVTLEAKKILEMSTEFYRHDSCASLIQTTEILKGVSVKGVYLDEFLVNKYKAQKLSLSLSDLRRVALEMLKAGILKEVFSVSGPYDSIRASLQPGKNHADLTNGDIEIKISTGVKKLVRYNTDIPTKLNTTDVKFTQEHILLLSQRLFSTRNNLLKRTPDKKEQLAINEAFGNTTFKVFL